MKARILFVDDDYNRIKKAGVEYQSCEIDFATCVPQALRMLCGNDYDIVSLDFDLNGHDFQKPDENTCGMEIVRQITSSSWTEFRKQPQFWIHSTNLFGARMMYDALTEARFSVELRPFGWKQYQRGVIAGAFDVIHPGYIDMFEDAKHVCHQLIILMHDKPNQVFSICDRERIVRSIRYVDEVFVYKTEDELDVLLDELKPDVRIVGSDHKGKTSRPNLSFPTYYHERKGSWSATAYKKAIAEAICQQETK